MQTVVQMVSGPGLPLVGNDIDTDRIIPARFLRSVTFDGLGEQVFIDDRAAGQHPFDQAAYQNAKILVVNRNFGCGSSREHAPQAIARWGIQAVVGESFAEIFFGNCIAIGVPCVRAEPTAIAQLQKLIAAQPTTILTVDLATQTIQANGQAWPIQIEPGPRQMFLSGTWDACGQLIAQVEAIQTTAQTLPYLTWHT
ncbi:3-isopropylmalate dehydratase small subunit [Romeria aff. gracilis LEGE 07310]|uniref:3-isopropylmalate dehydratase n=1 Tax=Vasconcelosia minhoensis LEGE 07310 TaxID=915328 RepID=A0A8J7DE16_9CYAN|nr:3-isopropylmalate dehydratase small subunit [Romeria aff. gracilis LEGE 07310]